MTNRERFYNNLNEAQPKHQTHALSYAIALTATYCCAEYSSIESTLYITTRDHLEKAERQENESDFLNIENLQALLLIVLYELRCGNVARAWMTQGRAMRLMKILGLAGGKAGTERPKSSMFQSVYGTPLFQPIAEESRRTVAVAYIIECYAALRADTHPTLEYHQVVRPLKIHLGPFFSSFAQLAFNWQH